MCNITEGSYAPLTTNITFRCHPNAGTGYPIPEPVQNANCQFLLPLNSFLFLFFFLIIIHLLFSLPLVLILGGIRNMLVHVAQKRTMKLYMVPVLETCKRELFFQKVIPILVQVYCSFFFSKENFFLFFSFALFFL